jgi:hypothetical protein
LNIVCLQSRDFSSKWRAIKQLVDDFSLVRMVVARKTERYINSSFELHKLEKGREQNQASRRLNHITQQVTLRL